MYPHRIRLRGPWECEPLARLVQHPDGRFEDVAGPLPAPRRLTMPCRWSEGGLADFRGRVRFRRRFGYPGRIDSFERVWLTFAGVEGSADVWLNGHSLGRHSPGAFEFEVTGLLQERNQLEVVMESPAHNGGLWGEIALEVRCTAFLAGVRARQAEGETSLHVSGEVVGICDRPLDLYVLVDGANAGYASVAAGQPFHLAIDRSANPSLSAVIRVELVNAATVWYFVEIPIQGEG